MQTNRCFSLRKSSQLTALILLGSNVFSGQANAQIIPDRTLNSEPSQVMQSGDFFRILGGARRGHNIYHSFQDFNIGEGQTASFSNPEGVTAIFSRVTGPDPSKLFGTLSVEGQAGLFLQNPRGVIFGPNARLDISGSLYVSTGTAWNFSNGYSFRSVNPNAPPLLSVDLHPGAQLANLPQAEIQSFADLGVGNNLVVHGQQLHIEGQLTAGKDLVLKAEDITIRDQSNRPFIAATGGDIDIQGNQAVDILAFNHPDSGIFAGENLTLRSSKSVTGNANFFSQGSFRIEDLDHNLGSLRSDFDPVIRSLGDVSFQTYEGASLHIIAAGKVDVPGSIFIRSSDTINGLQETITLSDQTTLNIDSQSQQKLDIRAGVDPNLIISSSFNPDIFSSVRSSNSSNPNSPTLGSEPTDASITIGSITLSPRGNSQRNSQVLITNQYNPKSEISSGNIHLNRVLVQTDSQASNITVDSRGSIDISGSIEAEGRLVGGDVKLLAQDHILVNDNARISSSTSRGKGGDITIKSPRLTVRNGGLIETSVKINGEGGRLEIDASDYVHLIEERETVNRVTGLAVSTVGEGKGGILEINTSRLLVDGGAQISVDTFDGINTENVVGGGNLIVNASESVELRGRTIPTEIIIDLTEPTPAPPAPGQERFAESLMLRQIEAPTISSGIITQSKTSGNSGQITINTPQLILEDRAFILSENRGLGRPLDLNINVADLVLREGGQIATNTVAPGAGATLRIDASQSILVSGRADLDEAPSLINARTTSSGNGGDLFLSAPRLIVENGGRVGTTTFLEGNAGNVNLNVEGPIVLNGVGSGIFSRTGGEGNAASLNIKAQEVTIKNGARTGVDNFVEVGYITLDNTDNNRLVPIIRRVEGEGNAGNLTIDTSILTLVNQGEITAQTTGGQGGNINLNINQLALSGNSTISANAGLEGTGGDGGNININAVDFILATPGENNDITANALTGNGGNINIGSPGIFGLTVQEDITPNSDITASSQTGQSGQIDLNGINPVNGVTNLPVLENISNDSQRFIADLEQKLTNQVTGFYDQRHVDIPLKSLTDIQSELREISSNYGVRTALVYISAPPQDTLLRLPKFVLRPRRADVSQGSVLSEPEVTQLALLQVAMVTGKNGLVRKRVFSDGALEAKARLFQESVLHPRGGKFRQFDFNIAQEWYQLLIAPLEQQLEAEGINSIVFLLDDGLRSLPLAALHDGEQFLVEKYTLSMMPSYSLTDTEYVDLQTTPTLALGTGTFQDLPDLPHVPDLIEYLEEQRSAQTLTDQAFTRANLTRSLAQQSYGVVHLGTHAKFLDAAPHDSFVQFADQRLKINQIAELGLQEANVGLLTLSACDTAVGNPELELGFAGLAHGAGVKSAVASLQEVSDEGTARLMRAFYDHLQQVPFKAEALRRAQVEMLQDKEFQHPYYWAWFTLVGNPW